MIMHNSPFNMRQCHYNLSVMKPPVSKNAAGTSKASLSYTTAAGNQAATSLDLLRQNIQRNINQDIQDVITKYINVFFKPGIENIRNNLGADAVTEDHISNMCRQILDEAKHMYPLNPIMTPGGGGHILGSVVETVNETEQKFIPPNVQQPQSSQVVNPSQQQPTAPDTKLPLTSPSFGIKRESDTDSEASCMSNASKKVKKSSNKVNNGNSSATGTGGDKKNNSSSSNNNDSASPPKPKKPSGPFRKHVALWDANRLTIDTMFIMGAKANKALGFAQTRGRLYVKHPGLFKYASDSDDKEWLSKNKLMPATGGRAYIMLLEDIEKLAKDNTLNVTINYEDIKGFKVPDFILDKMKNYINNWKKTYTEEDEKNAALQRNRSNNKQSTSNNNINNPPAPHSTNPLNSSVSHPGGTNHLNNKVIATNNIASINAPPPPSPSLPNMQQQYQKQQQHQNHVPQQQQQQQQPQSLNNFITGNSSSVLYDPSFSSSQNHEIPDYMHIDKPPPMYPGQPPQQQQQQHQTMVSAPGGGTYVHSNQLDPIEQAINKGDWSQHLMDVSDRSLLQGLLCRSTRSIGSWDPQDSFDLIESVTNGSLGGGGGLGEPIHSPLMQISPTAGAHLTAPPLLPVSPNCELSAVMLDQVSAFQYTET